MLLSIYLNDHLAGATGGCELARRAAGSNRGTEYGPALEDLAEQLAEDRRALLEVMRALDIGVDHLKAIAGWGAEKLGRLKLNGSVFGYSPLSRLVELEALGLGVHGKLAMWLTLERLEPEYPALADFDLAGLVERAERQLEEIEVQRVRAVDEALRATAPSSG